MLVTVPFFDENPVTLPRIAARLRRVLAQNVAARHAPDHDVGEIVPPSPRQDVPLTTLDATIRPIGSGRYRRLGWAPGEPHVQRDDLDAAPSAERAAARRSLVYFAQHTDVHITDAQSPARLVGAQALAWIHPGVDAAHRPQETMTTQVFDQLVRATNQVATSPFSGAPLAVCVQGGDHTDNRTVAETDWFLGVLTGGTVTPNTGAPHRYEGVQRSGWRTVWNPDLCGADRPQRHGHPFLPGVLDAAVAPFDAAGLDVPCVSVFGNHDRVFTGTFGPGEGLRIDLIEQRLHAGSRAPVGAIALIGELLAANLLANLPGGERRGTSSRSAGRRRGGTVWVAPDPAARQPIDEGAFAKAILERCGDDHVDFPGDASVTWWSHPFGDRVQMIGLDTSNHTDGEGGRIGPRQRKWLEAELARHHTRYLGPDRRWVTGGGTDRVIVIVSHHNSWVMDNTADDAFDPGPTLDGEELVDLLGRFPNVVLWVNGHSHEHRIAPHPARGHRGGFWEVSNTSVVGFGQQGRLFELFDNTDGTLSILSTVFDHAAPPRITYPSRTADWTAQMLASLSRELAANDDRWMDPMGMLGGIEDRNVELVVPAPFPLG